VLGVTDAICGSVQVSYAWHGHDGTADPWALVGLVAAQPQRGISYYTLDQFVGNPDKND
jgi:hypothetical protein